MKKLFLTLIVTSIFVFAANAQTPTVIKFKRGAESALVTGSLARSTSKRSIR